MVKKNIKPMKELETPKPKPTIYKIKQKREFSSAAEVHSIANMVERFVQSISQINDSGTFEASFEIKPIQSPQRVRHRCVTELDRENLMKFVRGYEARQAAQTGNTACNYKNNANNNNNDYNTSTKSTPKSSPFLCRKAKAIYQNAFVSSRSSSPKSLHSTDSHCIYEDINLQQQASPELMPAPAELPTSNLLRAQPERSSLRSAAKMLQFFSAKKKETKSLRPNSSSHPAATTTVGGVNLSRSRSVTASPVLVYRPLPTSSATSVVTSDAEDDGISSASSNLTRSSCSRNCSPDSSFELHPPLVPSYKVTPQKLVYKSSHRNPAYEFARFLRGSFHAKRASITTLRRSISDPDSFHNVDFTKPAAVASIGQCPATRHLAATKKPAHILADATNIKRSDVIRSRVESANVSPFRRAWVQSSFRTTRSDKQPQHQSPLLRRTASMTASDNDVYIKSMDSQNNELKQTRSHQQIGPNAINTARPKANVTTKVPQIKTENTSADAVAGPIGVAAWGTSFERLLEDPAGLHTFAVFLKKEFSAENIYFWTACERFRHFESDAERAAQAMAIYDKHLANGALEPVNVDSQARNLTIEKLQGAACDIFAHAQKQIFNLMKFDSYQRFIRSDLFKSCLEAETKRQALPYGAEDLDDLLKTNFHQSALSKLKKSASNAEDRRRKSLLPWHRKTRSKSRDRIDGESSSGGGGIDGSGKCPSKLPQLSGSSSLKIPSTQNSLSDVHSSRSSLSSFDALPNGQAIEATVACSLCRVILSDGATTIVQTRAGETVGQLVERLLEKRGLSYQFYDVVIANGGNSKSIDLNSAAQTLAGREVVIEQRVAFKLDLPDPKVISVKSKPKKQLHEVIRPILHKYNYTMESVQVLLRDTHAQLDLSLPVTVADGQRLQIVLLKPSATAGVNGDYQNGGSINFAKPALPKNVTAFKQQQQHSLAARNGVGCSNPSQSTLDEITNKVFNELLQGKVEAHAVADKQQPKPSDLCSLKSDDCASETSSIFYRMRRRDSNAPGPRLKLKKKSSSSQHSEEAPTAATAAATGATVLSVDIKKPIIAKIKAGVRLQVTERVVENQDELLEGLKRAQQARLEDQRGTEINFELPDFLKNKENRSAAASKLRKMRANLSPAAPASASEPTTPLAECPQPAPRLSITNRHKSASLSPMKIDEETLEREQQSQTNTSNSSLEADYTAGGKLPPPLPPKPKVLPIKPSNWGVSSVTLALTPSPTMAVGSKAVTSSAAAAATPLPQVSKIPIDIGRKAHLPGVEQTATTRRAYLEEPSSSFV